MDDNKKRALTAALGQIEKQFGKGAVMRMGDRVAEPTEVIGTGSLMLDMALGIGAPGHHGRHPGARSQMQRAGLKRAEQARGLGFLTSRDAPRRGFEGNALRWLPHGSAAHESRRWRHGDSAQEAVGGECLAAYSTAAAWNSVMASSLISSPHS